MAGLKKKRVTSKTDIALGKKGSDAEVAEVMGREAETDGSAVSVGTAVTLSKNYQSVRIDCHVTVPTTKDKVKEAAAEGWDFVGQQLSVKMKEASALLKKLG